MPSETQQDGDGAGRSGLYERYRLLVGYLLQHRGLSVDELLARRMDRADVERELVADGAL